MEKYQKKFSEENKDILGIFKKEEKNLFFKLEKRI
jgi:hypothetical protein